MKEKGQTIIEMMIERGAYQIQITNMSNQRDEAIWLLDIAVIGDGVTVKTNIMIHEEQADAIFEAINKWRATNSASQAIECGGCGP